MKKLFVVLMVALILVGCEVVEKSDMGGHLWIGDSTFVQTTVDATQLLDGNLRAKVDGEWQEFTLLELPQEFLEWNIAYRKEVIQGIMKGDMPNLEGPHNGIVATHGYKRGDSQFRVNNAIKGLGFLPKPERIEELIQRMKDTREEGFPVKLDVLMDFYNNAEDIFDMTKQVSLELYANPKRGTQTFLNQMTDPTSVIVFMAIPTYKLKTIAYLLHPKNPNLTKYEKNVVEYINLIHSYFHGDFPVDFTAAIYNVVEVYDSSPGKQKGMGTRIVP